MKTGDPQRPWVRIPPSPPFTTESPFTNFALEKYSRGRRGAPAKGVGRETGARVQIPPSPPEKAPHFRAGLFTLFAGIWSRPPPAADAGRIFWRSGRQGQGGCARRWPRRAPQEGLRSRFKSLLLRQKKPRTFVRGFSLCSPDLDPSAGRRGQKVRAPPVADTARTFWRCGRQSRGGTVRRRLRRAPQEGPRFPSRPHCPAST